MFGLSVIPTHSGFSCYRIQRMQSLIDIIITMTLLKFHMQAHKLSFLIYNLQTQPKFTVFPLSTYDQRIMKTQINLKIHPIE